MNTVFRTGLVCLFLVLFTGNILGEEKKDALLEQLSQTFKKDFLGIGALIQVVGDFQPERSFPGNNGYSIANLRFRLSGELDGGFGYFFQTNFLKSPAILDAKIYYRLSPALRFEAGQFKAPFSKEFLTYAGDIDFVNRAQVVTALAPGRQIGAQVSGKLHHQKFYYGLGMFNGNSPAANGNDNEEYLYAGRLAVFPEISRSDLKISDVEVGINAGFSKDTHLNFANGLWEDFTGDRLLLGGDLRMIVGPLLVAGEYIHARLESVLGETYSPHGFHATLGYYPNQKTQFLIRWDEFRSDGLLSGEENSELVIFGYNLFPSGATEIQVNYIIQTQQSNFDFH